MIFNWSDDFSIVRQVGPLSFWQVNFLSSSASGHCQIIADYDIHCIVSLCNLKICVLSVLSHQSGHCNTIWQLAWFCAWTVNSPSFRTLCVLFPFSCVYCILYLLWCHNFHFSRCLVLLVYCVLFLPKPKHSILVFDCTY